ncbi:MAG: ribosomal RNA small subunit methyltransferase A [Clostridia bacterium]|nr:ribosomal RNA small subunit methyltransferase A [Clostridia bacterium]
MDNELKRILNKYGFSFKKAFGQNFLSDETLLSEIVEKSGVNEDTTVLEIGCGAGALTKELAKKGKRIIGYEIDTNLKPVLSEVLSGFSNVELCFKDVMKEDIEKLEEKLGDNYIIVANLPYYITTPIVMRFVENAKKMKAMVIMVQEEVAKRFASDRKTSDYGAITVAINLRGKASIILKVNREKFTPVPNVDSAVVKIDIDRTKNVGVDLNKVRELVRVGFNNRRKTFVNNLMKTYSIKRETAEKFLTDLGFSLTVRGEELSADDYVIMSKRLGEYL